jgi:dTDP-4-dehydrorhamnose reductase
MTQELISHGIGCIPRISERDMKILITGASSLPGFRTIEKVLEKNYEVLAIYHKNPILIDNKNLRKIKLDIRNLDDFKNVIFKERPNIIIHMAALGDVDLCEIDKDLAWNTTVKPSIALANWASKLKIFLIYLSTDYVFDGESGNYFENSIPNPVNYYGLVKLLSEVAFMTLHSDYAIVRASSIYGLGPGRKNFAKFLIEKLERNEEVKALIDQYTTPTHAKLLSEAILEIIERKLTGIFHVVGEKMSRYEFALKLAETLGLNAELIKKAEMKDMKWIAKRPKDSSLNMEHTKSILKIDFYSNAKAFKILKEEYLELK